MSEIDLKVLGFTQEELQERVVERIVDAIIHARYSDEDGGAWSSSSEFAEKIKDAVKKRVDQKIDEMAEKWVFPNVGQFIEELTLQETNRWGEKKGEPVTFVEYLVARAKDYLAEPVSHDGKSKAEADYNWHGKQSRITYLVNSHLQYSIETAMKGALLDFNKTVANGINETVRLKINEAVAGIQASVTVGSKQR